MANAISRAGIAALAAVIVGGSSPPPASIDQPSYQAPARPWSDIGHAERERACRDRIEHARAAARKPELDRSPANPDEPLLMYAVDRRIDNCGVIVPVADPTDVRPNPKPGRLEMIPAR